MVGCGVALTGTADGQSRQQISRCLKVTGLPLDSLIAALLPRLLKQNRSVDSLGLASFASAAVMLLWLRWARDHCGSEHSALTRTAAANWPRGL